MIGILGGSFDPPHNGHRFISQYAMMRLNLQEVWWIVTYKNPLKKKSNSYNYRFQQVKNFIKFRRIKICKICEDKNIYAIDVKKTGIGIHLILIVFREKLLRVITQKIRLFIVPLNKANTCTMLL